MDESTKERIEKAIFRGEFEKFLNETREVLRAAEPLSSLDDIDEFIGSAVYRDFVRELQAWKMDIQDLVLTGQTDNSLEYLRGCISGVETAMGFPEYLKEQVSAIEEDDSNSQE